MSPAFPVPSIEESEMADRVATSAKSIEEDLVALREDLKNLTVSVAALAKEKTGALRDELGERTDQALASGRQAAESMQEAVRESPVTSMCVAFGIGVVIGHLLDRR